MSLFMKCIEIVNWGHSKFRCTSTSNYLYSSIRFLYLYTRPQIKLCKTWTRWSLLVRENHTRRGQVILVVIAWCVVVHTCKYMFQAICAIPPFTYSVVVSLYGGWAVVAFDCWFRIKLKLVFQELTQFCHIKKMFLWVFNIIMSPDAKKCC